MPDLSAVIDTGRTCLIDDANQPVDLLVLFQYDFVQLPVKFAFEKVILTFEHGRLLAQVLHVAVGEVDHLAYLLAARAWSAGTASDATHFHAAEEVLIVEIEILQQVSVALQDGNHRLSFEPELHDDLAFLSFVQMKFALDGVHHVLIGEKTLKKSTTELPKTYRSAFRGKENNNQHHLQNLSIYPRALEPLMSVGERSISRVYTHP